MRNLARLPNTKTTDSLYGSGNSRLKGSSISSPASKSAMLYWRKDCGC